jgi:hypothetical protein
VLLSPLASSLPDGLDWVTGRLGFESPPAAAWLRAPFPDYEVPALARLGRVSSAAGAIGTLVVFAVAFLLARGLRSGSFRGGHSAHAG